eukprot:scaffold246854_cov33-Tisochrysis_lutea.AAC.1
MVEFQGLAALSIKSSTDDSSHPNHIPVVAWLPALLSPELRQLSTQSLFVLNTLNEVEELFTYLVERGEPV